MKSRLLAAPISGIVIGATGMAGAQPREINAAQQLDDKGGDRDKGKGGDKDKTACKGQNGCRNKGGCRTDQHACRGQNDCRGQGGCCHT